jgi:hypothetical protein
MCDDEAREPYTVPHDLGERIDALDLRANVRDLVDDGYTIIQDLGAHALTDAVRAAILRLSQVTQDPIKEMSAAALLVRDPVFEQAVASPKLLAPVEFLLGRGAFLSQPIGSVRRKGPHPLGPARR